MLMADDRPIHAAITERLRAELGDYADGDLLPGDRELAERFGVSRMTVRQAVATLVTEGLIIRRRGSGTYVAKRAVHRRMARLLSFTEHMHRQGRTPSAQVIDLGDRLGTRAENADLDQPDGASVITLRRVLCGDGTPIAIEDVILPQDCGAVRDRDLTGSLHAALAAIGRRPRSARGTMIAEPAEPRIAKLLDIAIGSALMVQRLRILDGEDRPVQLVIVRYVGERIVFDIDQERPAEDLAARIDPPYEFSSLVVT
ncbi:GntR family transcriptional regulator [Microlunatus parietis]